LADPNGKRVPPGPRKTSCWTGSIAELLDLLQPEIERRPNLLHGLKTVPDAVRKALADRGLAVDADRRLVRLAERPAPRGRVIEPAPLPPPDGPLDGLLDHVAEVLRVIPQVILQGPPGTGKTYTAKRLAARLLEIGASAVDEEERKTTGEFHAARFSAERDGGCWELVQFHPAYAYHDFVRVSRRRPMETA
jgi:ATPase family protein associated with various cellular activities (AAA)